jgi:hypothetical protein
MKPNRSLRKYVRLKQPNLQILHGLIVIIGCNKLFLIRKPKTHFTEIGVAALEVFEIGH